MVVAPADTSELETWQVRSRRRPGRVAARRRTSSPVEGIEALVARNHSDLLTMHGVAATPRSEERWRASLSENKQNSFRKRSVHSKCRVVSGRSKQPGLPPPASHKPAARSPEVARWSSLQEPRSRRDGRYVRDVGPAALQPDAGRRGDRKPSQLATDSDLLMMRGAAATPRSEEQGWRAFLSETNNSFPKRSVQSKCRVVSGRSKQPVRSRRPVTSRPRGLPRSLDGSSLQERRSRETAGASSMRRAPRGGKAAGRCGSRRVAQCKCSSVSAARTATCRR
jgi:hypothetical protein